MQKRVNDGVCVTVWTRTDVEGSAVRPGLGHGVKGVTVLQALLTAGV